LASVLVSAWAGPGTLALPCQQATGRDAGGTNDFGADGPESEPADAGIAPDVHYAHPPCWEIHANPVPPTLVRPIRAIRDSDHDQSKQRPGNGSWWRPMNAAHVTGVPALAAGGVNGTVIGILIAIVVPVCAAVAVIGALYYRLQRHRADAVAMAAYRKLAEEAVANQQELVEAMRNLPGPATPAEQLMRDAR
jgi:hypothetical protein